MSLFHSAASFTSRVLDDRGLRSSAAASFDLTFG